MAAMIEVVTVITAPCAVVFDLELDVDVHAASLPDSRERATTGGGRRTLQLGDEVNFRARHFGLPWRMSSRVTAYERPHRFVDEQTRGPFRALHHEHLFEALGADSTRMTDRLHITAPAGMLGEAINRMLFEGPG
jgi:ligand-binding SRPBCC domain-containing protein